MENSSTSAARNRKDNPAMIYLDNNATTHEDPSAIAAMIDYLSSAHSFGNASSTHSFGRKSKAALEESREFLRSAIHAKEKSEILFTSGGTESNNLAIQGILQANLRHSIQHVITTPFEHPSVLNPIQSLAKSQGKFIEVSLVRIKSNGLVDLDHLRQLIKPHTRLISIMHANNEIGTIQPIEEIGRIARQSTNHQLIIHTDASQSLGKLPIDVQELGVDLLTICSHKFHGPKGIGALYVRHGIQLEQILFGANHEAGLRPGTENILAIIGLGKAAQIIANEVLLNQRIEQMKRTRDRLYQGLVEHFPNDLIQRNGDEIHSLPNTLNLSFKSINAKVLVQQLKEHLAFSTGSACHENTKQQSISTTLQAIGLSGELAQGTIRLSTSSMTTEEEIDQAIALISNAVEQQLHFQTNGNGFHH